VLPVGLQGRAATHHPLKARPRVSVCTPPNCDQVFTLSLGYIPHPNCDYHRLGGGGGGRRWELEEDRD
jgi:hypothetical protein